MLLLHRTDWHARNPRSTSKQDYARELFIHHSDDTDAKSITTVAEVKSKARQIQNFHMDTREWSDIAYHYLVFQPYGSLKQVVVCKARSVFAVPAAQLNHNTNTIAVCVIGNFETDRVKPETVKTLKEIIRRHPNVRKVGGHRDVVSTACPGKNLYAEIPGIASGTGRKHF